jgi:transcription antitermination factor NusG
MSNFKPGWYLLYTRPRFEKKVAIELARLNTTCFLPTTKKLRIWWDRKKYIDEPLFPSYVFVCLKSNHDFHNSVNVPGVLGFVRTGKHIQIVNDRIVNNLMILMNQSSELEVSSSDFHIGQELVIRQGPLAGLYCEVIRINNKQKLLVRVGLLQRSVVLNIGADDLIPVYGDDCISIRQ